MGDFVLRSALPTMNRLSGVAIRRCARPMTTRKMCSAPLKDEAIRTAIPSYGPIEEINEAQKWKYISFAGLAVVGTAMYIIMSGHHEAEPDPPAAFKKIRKKPFPWAAGDCDLFDIECKRAFKEAQGK